MIYLLERINALDPQKVLARLPELTEERQKRIASYRLEKSAAQSVLAELLLRYAVRRELGLRTLPRIELTEHRKPFFPERPDCCFNLSHCDTAVACGIDRAPLGVDVQELRRYDARLSRVLSEDERRWVEAGQSDVRFTQLWTLKEAYGKKTGQGIAYDLRSMTLIPQGKVWMAQSSVFQSNAREELYFSVCAERELPLVIVSPQELLL